MKKLTKYIWIIHNLDIFGQPILFYIDGKTKHTSLFGGFLTLIISIIMIIVTFNSFISLVTKANISTEEFTAYEMFPPYLNFTENNFMFLLRVDDDSLSLNNSLFSFSASLTIRGQSSEILEELPIELRSCQSKDFENIIPNSGINIQNSLCPANSSYGVYGANGNPKFQELRISVTKCVENSNAYITCASEDFINEYFKQTQKVKLRLYFVNRFVDLQDITNPIKSFIDEQSWNVSPLGQLAYSTNLYFIANQVISYDDILGISKPNTYNIITYKRERIDHIFVPPKDTDLYVEIKFRSSNYRNIYTRTYDTLLTFLSFIGGISSILMGSVGFIVGIVNSYKYNMKMLNKLYDFDIREDYNEKNYLKKRNNLNISNNSQLDGVIYDPKVKQKFDRMQNLRARLVLTIGDFVKCIYFCFKSKINMKKNDLYNLGIMQLVKDMDIIRIMKKMQNFEKLKTILLYPDKLKIFNFLPPPIISMNNHDTNLHDITKLIRKNTIVKSTSNEMGSEKICQHLNEYYENSEIYSLLKKQEDQISQNIITSLDPEIAEIFECIEEVKDHSSSESFFQNINQITSSEIGASSILNGKKDLELFQVRNLIADTSLGDIRNKFNSSNIKESRPLELTIFNNILSSEEEKEDKQPNNYKILDNTPDVSDSINLPFFTGVKYPKHKIICEKMIDQQIAEHIDNN